jgi:hypothetical protein
VHPVSGLRWCHDEGACFGRFARAVLYHRWVIAQETFTTFLGLAIFGTWLFALDGYYLITPIGLFIVAGIFMSACAVADLLFGSAHAWFRTG